MHDEEDRDQEQKDPGDAVPALEVDLGPEAWTYGFRNVVTVTGGTKGDLVWALDASGPGQSIPPGLSLSSVGVLYGIPELAGSYTFEIVATLGEAEARREYTLDIANPYPGTVSIAAGQYHSCAVSTAGAAYCWGESANGLLGNMDSSGTEYRSAQPVTHMGSGVLSVSAGKNHSCAVKSDGTAWCWGHGGGGVFGDVGFGGIAPFGTRVGGSAGMTGFTKISAGALHTCAVRNGGAFCWGSMLNGRLGNGFTSTSTRNTPQQVIGLLSGVVDISAGDSHSCAVKDDGTVWCWGNGASGRLGNNMTAVSNVPVQVEGLADADSVYAGYDSTCALRENGQALCWGDNSLGKLGIGNLSTPASSPVPMALSGTFRAISVGRSHACAVGTNGLAYCWGAGNTVEPPPMGPGTYHEGEPGASIGPHLGLDHCQLLQDHFPDWRSDPRMNAYLMTYCFG